MVLLGLSFLLSFPFLEDSVSERLHSSSHSSQIEKKRRESEVVQDGDEAVPMVEFNSSNLQYNVIILYELLGNKHKTEVNLLVWGPIAKIFTKMECINVYTIIRGNTIWVPVVIEQIVDLTVPEMKSLRDRIIEVNIINKRLRDDSLKIEKFSIKESDIISNSRYIERKFFKVYNDKNEYYAKSVTKYLPSMKSLSSKGSSQICLNPKLNRYDFMQIVDGLVDESRIKKTEHITNFDVKNGSMHKAGLSRGSLLSYNKVRGGVQSKSRMKERLSTLNVVYIHIPAETFFVKPEQSIYYKQCDTEHFIKNCYIVPSADNLLSTSEKLDLNPIVINLIKLQNFPEKLALTEGFKFVYATYEIPQVLSYKTKLKRISKTIYFNDAHIYFTDEIPKIKLLEALQTQRFTVEIYGIRDSDDVEHKHDYFGTKPEDYEMSTMRASFEEDVVPQPYYKPVLLAVSKFDLSSLVDNVWNFRESMQCHEPNITLAKKPNYDNNKKLTSVIDVNLDYPIVETYIPESIFIELDTTVTIEAYLLAPQAPSLVYHYAANTFKRLFLIVEDDNLAKTIFNEIHLNNKIILDEVRENTKDVSTLNESGLFTGFIIDNGSSYFFYFEGPANGNIDNIWHFMEGGFLRKKPVSRSKENYSGISSASLSAYSAVEEEDTESQGKIKIFFNSDNAFEKRLYKDFLTVGVLNIVLKIPLQQIMSKPLLYVKKNVPRPCMEALKKLDLLFATPGYNDVLQQNLLPTSQELESLNLEWGVPNRWQNIYEPPPFVYH